MNRLGFNSLLLAAALMAGAAWGDTITLKDGRKLTGDVKRNATGWTVVDASGQKTDVPADLVAGIEAEGSAAGPDAQRDRLESLRRSVANLADSRQVIDRYQQFIRQYPDGAVADQAKGDLATWQDRLARGLVRVGAKWITPEERDALLRGHGVLVEQARQQIRQSRPREAEPLIAQVLLEDPANAGALYLRGVIQFRADQFPAARKSFEAALAVVPNHPATLNNLAVILWRQNSPMGAINLYQQAMKALPLNYDILNNVSEALHGIAPERRNDAAVIRAQKEFDDQDSKLQAALNAQKLYRWGSVWVGPDEIAKLKEIEKEIKQQQDALAAEFEKTRAGLMKIDLDIESNDRTLRQIEASLWVRDTEGQMVRLAPPPVYYDIARDSDRLRMRKQDEMARLDQIRIASRDLNQKFPKPKFTGVQNLIGPEGTPLPAGGAAGPRPLVPPPSPTQPASQPVNPLTE